VKFCGKNSCKKKTTWKFQRKNFVQKKLARKFQRKKIVRKISVEILREKFLCKKKRRGNFSEKNRAKIFIAEISAPLTLFFFNVYLAHGYIRNYFRGAPAFRQFVLFAFRHENDERRNPEIRGRTASVSDSFYDGKPVHGIFDGLHSDDDNSVIGRDNRHGRFVRQCRSD
jgi:hypothetical protein